MIYQLLSKIIRPKTFSDGIITSDVLFLSRAQRRKHSSETKVLKYFALWSELSNLLGAAAIGVAFEDFYRHLIHIAK